MKSIFRSTFALLLALTSSTVFAESRLDMGVLAGYRLNDATAGSGVDSIDGKGGFQVGGLAFLPLTEVLSLRTGFIYAERNYDVTAGTSDIEAKIAHLDIPVTVMYSVGDFGGIFAGAALGLKIKDKCGGGDCDGVKSTIIPIQIGGHFKVAPQFALEVAFETAPSDIADGVEDPSAVVVNAVVTFE